MPSGRGALDVFDRDAAAGAGAAFDHDRRWRNGRAASRPPAAPRCRPCRRPESPRRWWRCRRAGPAPRRWPGCPMAPQHRQVRRRLLRNFRRSRMSSPWYSCDGRPGGPMGVKIRRASRRSHGRIGQRQVDFRHPVETLPHACPPAPLIVPFTEVRHFRPEDCLHYEPIDVRGRLHHWTIPAHRHDGLHQFQLLTEGLDGGDPRWRARMCCGRRPP